MTITKFWRQVIINQQTTVLDAMQVIDKGSLQVALVTDASSRLLGVVTDGDIRRGLLRGVSFRDSVEQVMCYNPTVAKETDSIDRILSLMASKEIEQVPIVDADGFLVGLKTLEELTHPRPRDNWVILMAGGLGSRLGDLTKSCPKPLLKVGSKPILEVILESFISQGFYKFFLSVNYKKEMIQQHFGDGSRWGVDIQYIEETERRGTAGPLAMLPEVPSKPFFVMNGDLLTRINFHNILDFHNQNASMATLCVRKIEQTIPYGVVHVDKHHLVNIEEKPVQEYFVNAGIYLLDPCVINYVPREKYFDMPDLFRQMIDQGYETTAFPFLDYWLDIGRMSDFKQACQDYPEFFS